MITLYEHRILTVRSNLFDANMPPSVELDLLLGVINHSDGLVLKYVTGKHDKILFLTFLANRAKVLLDICRESIPGVIVNGCFSDKYKSKFDLFDEFSKKLQNIVYDVGFMASAEKDCTVKSIRKPIMDIADTIVSFMSDTGHNLGGIKYSIFDSISQMYFNKYIYANKNIVFCNSTEFTHDINKSMVYDTIDEVTDMIYFLNKSIYSFHDFTVYPVNVDTLFKNSKSSYPFSNLLKEYKKIAFAPYSTNHSGTK